MSNLLGENGASRPLETYNDEGSLYNNKEQYEFKPTVLFLYNQDDNFYSQHIEEALINIDLEPVKLDYDPVALIGKEQPTIGEIHLLTKDKEFERRLFGSELSESDLNKSDKQELIYQARKHTDKFLKESILRFIKKNKISALFIPGDLYNYDSEPYHPEPKNRPRYIKALLEIAKELNIPTMGVCGGLQGILHHEGIKLARVSEQVGHQNSLRHLLSDKQPGSTNINFLSEVSKATYVQPNTKLHSELIKIAKKLGTKQSRYKPIIFNAPEAHGGAIDITDQENIDKLHDKGYVVSARSCHDDIIQGVEHKEYDILLFQNHPESLLAANDIVMTSLFESMFTAKAREYHKQHYGKLSHTLVEDNKSQDQEITRSRL